MNLFLATVAIAVAITVGDTINTNNSNVNSEQSETSVTESEQQEPNNTEAVDNNDQPDVTSEDEANSWIYTQVDLSKITNTMSGVLEYHGDFSEDQLKVLEQLRNKLAKYPYQASLVGYKLDGTQAICYNSDMTHYSACTIKAAYIYSLCRYMEENNTDLNQELTYLEKHKFDGAGKIRYSPFGTKYSIRYLINNCLSISDNVAYRILLDKFGTSYHDKIMEEIGCNSLKISGMWANKCTAKDFVILWSAIYDYFTHNDSEYAKLFKESCTNTIWNYSCETVKGYDYSHKSGDNYAPWDAQNDACIVWKENPYVFALFVKASFTYLNESQRNEITALVHQKLW